MATNTTNYNFTLPAVNSPTDQDLWGTQLNGNFSSLDALLLTATNNVTRSLTGNTTLSATDQNKLILADATSASFTITLQAAATAGSGFKMHIKKTDSSAHTVTVRANGAENIDQANTYVISTQDNSVTIISDGTQWWIVPVQAQVIPTATTSVAGILKLATNAITKTGTDATTAVTPAALASLATASSSGSIVLGAVTIQWGQETSGGTTVTFNAAFSNTPYALSMMNLSATTTGYQCSSLTNTGFTFRGYDTNTGSTRSTTLSWIAIGPT